MIDLFIDENDLTEIKIYVGIENGKLVASSKAEDIKEVGLTNSIWVRQLDYKTNAEIASQSIKITGGDFQINPSVMRYKNMVKSIVKWDLKDKDGKDIEFSEQAIGRLNPAFAGAIADTLDKMTDKTFQKKE